MTTYFILWNPIQPGLVYIHSMNQEGELGQDNCIQVGSHPHISSGKVPTDHQLLGANKICTSRVRHETGWLKNLKKKPRVVFFNYFNN